MILGFKTHSIMTATVKYRVATYQGEVEVPFDPDGENEDIIAKS